MKTFRDNTGREWVVQIHVTAVKRTRALVGVDLYGLVDEGFKGLGELLARPDNLVDVLYVLCKDEADARKVSDEDFGWAMGGDSLQAGADAFLAELVDFFPDPRVRAGLQRVIEAGRKVTDRLMETMAAKLAAIDPEAVADRLSGSSGGSPASSASTPDPSPSASSST